jgi:hypothetical protein
LLYTVRSPNLLATGMVDGIGFEIPSGKSGLVSISSAFAE